LDGADPRKLEASLAAAEERFGTTDVIGHRTWPVPGSVETVEFRASDPRTVRTACSAERLPEGPGQVVSPTERDASAEIEDSASTAVTNRRRHRREPTSFSDGARPRLTSSAGAPDTVTVLRR
jgi:hypothetical protein